MGTKPKPAKFHLHGMDISAVRMVKRGANGLNEPLVVKGDDSTLPPPAAPAPPAVQMLAKAIDLRDGETLGQFEEALRAAFRKFVNPADIPNGGMYLCAVFDGQLVAEKWNEPKTFVFDWTRSTDGEFAFGEPVEVERKVTFEPVGKTAEPATEPPPAAAPPPAAPEPPVPAAPAAPAPPPADVTPPAPPAEAVKAALTPKQKLARHMISETRRLLDDLFADITAEIDEEDDDEPELPVTAAPVIGVVAAKGSTPEIEALAARLAGDEEPLLVSDAPAPVGKGAARAAIQAALRGAGPDPDDVNPIGKAAIAALRRGSVPGAAVVKDDDAPPPGLVAVAIAAPAGHVRKGSSALPVEGPREGSHGSDDPWSGVMDLGNEYRRQQAQKAARR